MPIIILTQKVQIISISGILVILRFSPRAPQGIPPGLWQEVPVALVVDGVVHGEEIVALVVEEVTLAQVRLEEVIVVLVVEDVIVLIVILVPLVGRCEVQAKV